MLTTWVSTGGMHCDDDGHTQGRITLTYVIKMKSLSFRESLNVVKKIRLLFILFYFCLDCGLWLVARTGLYVRKK